MGQGRSTADEHRGIAPGVLADRHWGRYSLCRRCGWSPSQKPADSCWRSFPEQLPSPKLDRCVPLPMYGMTRHIGHDLLEAVNRRRIARQCFCKPDSCRIP